MAFTDSLAVQTKQYAYKVTDQTGTYIGEWTDVSDDLEFSQQINTPGTTTTVKLARSARSTVGRRDTLVDDTSDPLTTQDGNTLIAEYVTTNSIGSGTDVDMNHSVDVYVAYGDFESLLTQSGQELTDETGDVLLFAIGAPLGARVFSGYIVDYSEVYSGGQQDGVEVTLMSNGAELSQYIIKNGTATTRTYTTTDHGTVIKNILDMNTGKMDYVGTSVATTGVTITPTFQLNTALEGIQQVYDQSPDGWYWYGNVADNTVYYQLKGTTADHTFTLGKHIKDFKLKKTIENLKNDVYFVGGDVAGTPLYKRYTDTSTITRTGIDRKTDRRYTLASSTQKYSDKVFSRFSEPAYTTGVTVLATVYEIESIQLGQMVGFSNFGTFVDTLILQVVGRHYTPTAITLDLGELLDRQTDTISSVEKSVQGEQYETLPTTPS
jgi:hypothetical protein